jgi:hypothetical protein
MSILWASPPIQIRGELALDAKATTEGVTLGRFMDAVLAEDLVLTPEQAMELADALTQGATRCLAAREG